jgi:hypothetical protein
VRFSGPIGAAQDTPYYVLSGSRRLFRGVWGRSQPSSTAVESQPQEVACSRQSRLGAFCWMIGSRISTGGRSRESLPSAEYAGFE